jgi:hypothetical protein
VADAPVFIAQYDPAWLAAFDSERDLVAATGRSTGDTVITA